jgi:hypothetical protein
MSARKLSRLAGFALVLAAVFGGVATARADQATQAAPPDTTAVVATLQGDVVWT